MGSEPEERAGTPAAADAAASQGATRPLPCPKCRVAMAPYQHSGVTLDLCQRCHGLWFDRGELEKVEHVGIELVRLKVSDISRRSCPRCSGRLIEGRLPGPGGLLLDECDRCGGLFFDAGELDRLRRHKAQARRATAAADERALREFAERKRRDREEAASASSELAIEDAWSSNRNLLSYLLELPIEEDSSHERPPYGLFALLGVIAAVWLWQLASPASLWMGLATVPSDIVAGRHLYTLLTAAFLHGGWLHLLGNAYFLWTFGDNVEDRVGTWAFLAWYLVWALAGSLAFVIFAKPAERGIPGLGASGAIAGVMGAYLVLYPRRRLIVRFGGFLGWGSVWKLPAWSYLIFWASFQVLAAALGLPDVGWWAHLGGFATGALVGSGYRACNLP
jgi:membrane associated rhomboid family serine protease/Zn-finger nucleic acid-binding protein